MAIWLTQCLCEQRHCIISGAFDDELISVAQGALETQQLLTTMLTKQLVNPWCRVCKSPRFHYETGRTPFKTMEDAGPALAFMEAMNIASGDLLEQINAAHRSKAN